MLVDINDFDLFCYKLKKSFQMRPFEVIDISNSAFFFIKKKKFQSSHWEKHLYNLLVVTEGRLVVKKKKAEAYVVADFSVKKSFFFNLLLLLVTLVLIFNRFDFNLFFVPMVIFFFASLMYCIYYLKLKCFLKSVVLKV